MLRPRTLPAGFIEPCLPSSTKRPPSGKGWLHEIKHDGFRIIARKNGNRVRLYSRPGNDLTRRFPRITEAVARLRGADLHHRRGGGRLRTGWHRLL
jgi:ATP-dependent DNA ligase